MSFIIPAKLQKTWKLKNNNWVSNIQRLIFIFKWIRDKDHTWQQNKSTKSKNVGYINARVGLKYLWSWIQIKSLVLSVLEPTSVEMLIFGLILLQYVCGKWFCLIWWINGRFAKKDGWLFAIHSLTDSSNFYQKKLSSSIMKSNALVENEKGSKIKVSCLPKQDIDDWKIRYHYEF